MKKVIQSIFSILIFVQVSCQTKVKKTIPKETEAYLYCNQDSVNKWEREHIVDSKFDYYVILKNKKVYQDTTYFPPIIRTIQLGDTMVESLVKVDTIPVAIYVIKGDEGEPVCIAAFKVTNYYRSFKCQLIEDTLTKRHYDYGNGISFTGENEYNRNELKKYIAWDKSDLPKDWHIIREKHFD